MFFMKKTRILLNLQHFLQNYYPRPRPLSARSAGTIYFILNTQLNILVMMCVQFFDNLFVSQGSNEHGCNTSYSRLSWSG